MKIKYLGTAAAEGIPGMFCDCRVCKNALKVRGKEIKTRSQTLVDDKILIDFPADTYLHVINYGLDLRKIHNCIITHCHSDHFYPSDFWCRTENVVKDIDGELNIYVTRAGYNQAVSQLGNDMNSARLKFHIIKPFEPFDIEDYHIIPLAASHDPASDPVIYIIEHGEKSLLYANDTGIFPGTTWEYLEEYNRKFNMISLDCTTMPLDIWRDSHMGFVANKEIHNKLMDMGLCGSDTAVYVNHFSHNGLLTHEEAVVEAEKYGFLMTYDGIEVEC